jgi:hypothetical protein
MIFVDMKVVGRIALHDTSCVMAQLGALFTSGEGRMAAFIFPKTRQRWNAWAS